MKAKPLTPSNRFSAPIILAIFALGVFAALLPGCQALGKASDFLIKKTPTVVRPAQTNIIEVVRTNFVGVTTYLTNYVTVQVATTNATTGAVTPAVIQPQITANNSVVPFLQTNLQAVVLPAVVVTNLSLAPTVTGAVQIAGDLAPVPWAGGVGSILLGVAGSIFGFINHRRANAALGQKETWQATARTLVGNVETLRTAALKIPGYTPAVDAQVMRVIEGAQYAAGVKEEIAGVVAQHTDQTLPDNFYGNLPNTAAKT